MCIIPGRDFQKDGGGQQCLMQRKGKLEQGRKEVGGCSANGDRVKDSFCSGASVEAREPWCRQSEGVDGKWRLSGHGKWERRLVMKVFSAGTESRGRWGVPRTLQGVGEWRVLGRTSHHTLQAERAGIKARMEFLFQVPSLPSPPHILEKYLVH